MPGSQSLITRLAPLMPQGAVRDVVRSGTLEVVSQRGLSRFLGFFTQRDMPASIVQKAIQAYIRYYDVDVDEMELPPEAYKSFDAFFTRKLKPGVHTIDSNKDVAVSPVDGRVLNFGKVADGRIDQIKGRSYTIEDLLGGGEVARKFSNGHYVTLYLSPRDYHRIHTPVDGKVTGFKYIPGRLYPVNNLGVYNVDRLFAVNERLISYIKSDLGAFAVVKVGATNVGMISASYHSICTNRGSRTSYDEKLRHPVRLSKGDELGQFHLGSTVVLLSENPDLKPLCTEVDEYMRVGQALLKADTKKAKSSVKKKSKGRKAKSK